jgi:hypothetical protein
MTFERQVQRVIGRALVELYARPRSRWWVVSLVMWRPLTHQERWLWMSMSSRLASDRTRLKLEVRRLGGEA